MGYVRPHYRAGSFYPGSVPECAKLLEACRREEAELPAEILGKAVYGGIVPHAGWIYSGPTALLVWDALQQSATPPETVLIFATAHRSDVDVPSLQREGAWKIPGAEVAIDAELAAACLGEAGPERLIDRPEAHAGDHAIEVQLPMFRQALPEARFVPVAVPHDCDGEALGLAAARAVAQLKRSAVALASTDLTHYGPNYYGFAPQGVGAAAHAWSKDVNDRAFLDRALALDARGAVEAGESDASACGPQAAAAAIAFARARGASRGVLLEHKTSYERRPSVGAPSDFVGYAAVVFL
ncbi:MAG: AmmeMemoRadiSam system protein B [Planctomycetes bacterium]|nr:AmmeMemoRadiSam system protein B [Planctomycetota bacterium]